jgi:hypothetical protein
VTVTFVGPITGKRNKNWRRAIPVKLTGLPQDSNTVTSVEACKRHRIWGSMFLKPEDLEKVRVSSLLSLVATRLGLVS